MIWAAEENCAQTEIDRVLATPLRLGGRNSDLLQSVPPHSIEVGVKRKSGGSASQSRWCWLGAKKDVQEKSERVVEVERAKEVESLSIPRTSLLPRSYIWNCIGWFEKSLMRLVAPERWRGSDGRRHAQTSFLAPVPYIYIFQGRTTNLEIRK